MKLIITSVLSLLYSFSFCQKKPEKIATLIPIYDFSGNEKSSDSNANKIGFIPFEIAFNNSSRDTVWMRENIMDGDNSYRWLFTGKDDNENRWYIDKDYVNKASNVITTWISIKEPKRTFNNKVYKDALEMYLISVDPYKKAYKVLQNAIYNSNGDIIGKNLEGKGFVYPAPESMMETLIKIILERYK